MELEPNDTPAECICPITMTKIENILIVQCGHSFERGPMLHWLQFSNSCPVCRIELNIIDYLNSVPEIANEKKRKVYLANSSSSSSSDSDEPADEPERVSYASTEESESESDSDDD